jgi:hypothetical protein
MQAIVKPELKIDRPLRVCSRDRLAYHADRLLLLMGDTSRNGNLCTFAESRCVDVMFSIVNPDSDNELRPVQERRILHLDLADYDRLR